MWWEDAARAEAAGGYEPGDYDDADPDPTPLTPAQRARWARLQGEALEQDAARASQP